MQNCMTERGIAATNIIRLGEDDFRKLPFGDKRTYLDGVLPQEKLALIMGDPDGKKLARAMQPHEFYWLFKESGGPEAMELLGLSSPEQCVFILDMELWKGWTFSEDKAVEFLGYILKGSEEHFLELLPHLDFNILSLFLGRELVVAGGDWRHRY